MSLRDRVLHGAYRSDVARRIYSACLSIPILGMSLRRAMHSALPLGARVWIRIPSGVAQGYWIRADPRTELGYTNGDHEPWLQDLLKSELQPGGCYYDVGAHAGFFCLAGARSVGPSGTVVAIEADPRNAWELRANLDRNQLTQVVVFEAAVWSSTGRVSFLQDSTETNRTQGHIVDHGGTQESSISVQAVRLDDLIWERGFRAPDLIKMDIEGAEWEALQGACRLLAEARPKLLCEIHHPEQMEQIQSYLQGFGYSAEEWRPVHPHYTDYRQLYLWAVPTRPRQRVPAALPSARN